MKLKNEGKYSILILFNGIDINSSPFQIEAFPIKIKAFNEINQPKLAFGSNGNGNGQFNSPYGIIVNSNGNIIVSELYNHRIQIFKFEGNFISTFGSQGNANGQFKHRRGMAVNSKGNII